MEWTVVTALVVLVGLFFTVGKPILALNRNIVELNLTMKQQATDIKRNAEEIKDQKKHAQESHKRLWEHNSEQDDQLKDHELRIGALEHKGG